MRGTFRTGSGSVSSILIVFFVLTITFCLISAGIFKADTSIGMVAYAKKSKESSGGSSGSDGGKSKSSDSGSNKGGDNSGGGSSDSASSGGETGGNDNPTTEEPSKPPPQPIEPTPTVVPPSGACEQGSTAPVCSASTGPPQPPGPIDCSTSPNDPSCNTTTPPGGPVDCNINPNNPSCGTPTPIDCKTNPSDPSCTQLPPTVDCKANPNDASCTTPQPVDCKTNPDDPSCKPDCTKNPDDASCKVDCQSNPNDPSCPSTPPCQSAVIGISCPPVDCAKTPDDPSCPPPVHIDCPEKVGFTLRAIENGKCVYDPIKCPPGQHFDPKVNKCVPNVIKCPKGQHYDANLKKCIPDCSKGQHFNPILNGCVPDCPPGFHLENKVCTKTIVKHVTTVETVVRNFGISNQPSSYMLLLDTAQLCQLAGDTQCVAKQNQFDTLNLVTKLDSTGKTWTITGQVENRVSKTQNNMQVTGYFYDSKGNSVGGPYRGTVNPTSLKSLQLGAFSMKPSTSIMKGTPSFIRLEYQSTTAP